MKRRIMLITTLAPIVAGLGTSFLTLLDLNSVHISVIYPEYPAFESVYIDARGFPIAMWAKNDPAFSGYGEPDESIVWSGIAGNWVLWTIGLYILEAPVVLAAGFLALIKRRPGSANTVM